MNNIIVLGCYTISALMMVWVIIGAIRRYKHRRLRKNILFLAAVFLCWQLSEICQLTARSEEWAVRLYDLNLPFVAFVSVAILLYVIRFFNLDTYHTPLSITLLSVIPSTTLVLALTSPLHSFLHEDLQILGLWPQHNTVVVRGIWFWIHAGYCYALVIGALLIALAQHKNSPSTAHQPTLWLIRGISLSILGNILHIQNILPLNLDLSLVCSSICVVFLYVSTKNRSGLYFLHQVRNAVLNEVPQAILVLDDEGYVINLNTAARQIITRAGAPVPGANGGGVYYHRLVEHVFYGAKRQSAQDSEINGADYYCSANRDHAVYNLREKEILDNKRKIIGIIAIWTDVTENRAKIRKLEVDSGIDVMTGLINRRQCEKEMKALDTPDNLPLAIVIADLNNLKVVNDTLGHQYGDILLRSAAEGLINCCPPKAVIARLGGDEFMILIPNCSQAQAEELIRSIDAYFENNREPVKTSLALGASIRLSINQTEKEIMEQADAMMYLDKRHKKKLAKGRSDFAAGVSWNTAGTPAKGV